jgi:hypothetical protein
MRLMKLWPTNILVDQIKYFSAAENEELASIAEDYVNKKMVHTEGGFKHAIPNNLSFFYKSKALEKYIGFMEQYFWYYLKTVIDLSSDDITPIKAHMFANVEKRGDWSVPHAHMGNQVIVTYYPKIVRSLDEPHPHAGKMVFHNPRNPPSGFWARKELLFTPIDITSGTIVVFPGHSEHSTFPFFCEGSAKHAIITNIRFAGIIEGTGYTSNNYIPFSEMKQACKNTSI